MPIYQGVVRHSVHTLVFRSLKRTHDMFLSEEGQPISEDDRRLILFIGNLWFELKNFSLQQKISCKVRDEYSCLQKVLLPNEAANRVKSIPATKPAPGNCISYIIILNLEFLVETATIVTNRQAYPSGPGMIVKSL